jgi:hypothetical protein
MAGKQRKIFKERKSVQWIKIILVVNGEGFEGRG